MATNAGGPIVGEHDGWKLASSSAIRPTEQQLKESLGAPAVEPAAKEEADPDGKTVVVEADGSTGAAVVDDEPAKAAAVAKDDGTARSAAPAATDGKPKKLTRAEQINRDIANLTRQKGDITRETEAASAKRQALADEIAVLEAKRTALTAAPAKVEPTGPKPALNTAAKPAWADFEKDGKTYDEFLDARDDWNREEHRLIAREESTKLVTDRETAAREASSQDARTRAEAQISAQFSDRLAAARDKHADVDFDLVLAQPLPIAPTMPGFRPVQDIIRISEVGPELLLYFYEHPDDSRRIAELPHFAAVREMARLEERVTTAHSGSVVPPARSSAHAPIRPVRVAAPVASDARGSTPDDMPFGAGYLAATNKRLGMR